MGAKFGNQVGAATLLSFRQLTLALAFAPMPLLARLLAGVAKSVEDRFPFSLMAERRDGIDRNRLDVAGLQPLAGEISDECRGSASIRVSWASSWERNWPRCARCISSSSGIVVQRK